MRLFLVRHGCAGRKQPDPVADLERPLDDTGRVQAQCVHRWLSSHAIGGPLRSSPARRCVETLRPTADAAHVGIGLLDALGPSAAPADALAALTRAGNETQPDRNAVIACVHGELLSPLLRLCRAHVTAGSAAPPDDATLLAKGTIWELELMGGRVVSLTHHVPTGLPKCPTHGPGSRASG
jgi:phosphohistidine phosphatase SixA